MSFNLNPVKIPWILKCHDNQIEMSNHETFSRQYYAFVQIHKIHIVTHYGLIEEI